MPDSNAIISVRNINLNYQAFEKSKGLRGALKDFFRRRYTNSPALQNISFNIQEGEFIGLLGPNGAGKTSLLKILSGLVHPSSGNATVLGYTPYKKEKKFLQDIGMVMGQKSQLLWDLPPIDTFNILKEIYNINALSFEETLEECVSLLNVKHKLETPIRHLSLGERMKFEIIASLLHQPKLLFLDEPTIGLDIISQQAIRDFLKKINKEKRVTIIITSHYLRDLEILADRLVILKKGQIVFDGTQTELKSTFHKSQQVVFQTQATDFSLPYSISYTGENRYSVQIAPEEMQQVLSKIVSTIPLTSLKTEEISLEEMICQLFQEGHPSK